MTTKPAVTKLHFIRVASSHTSSLSESTVTSLELISSQVKVEARGSRYSIGIIIVGRLHLSRRRRRRRRRRCSHR